MPLVVCVISDVVPVGAQEDQPVKMLKGTHTFYAILVDEHNKVSSPGSAIYKLTEAK